MKKQTIYVRLLAMLLISCLLMGSCLSAMAAEPPVSGDTINASSGEQLVEAVKTLNAKGGGTINLSNGRYYLTFPLIITASITIRGSGEIRQGDGSFVLTLS